MSNFTSAGLADSNIADGAIDDEVKDFEHHDFDRESRQRLLAAEIQVRVRDGHRGAALNETYVIETAAQRCFQLMAMELHALAGFLTESELVDLLNMEPAYVWTWRSGSSLVNAMADTYGIESLDDESPMTPLVKKLLKLSPAQDLALLDLCEQIWRGKFDRPIADVAAQLGLELA